MGIFWFFAVCVFGFCGLELIVFYFFGSFVDFRVSDVVGDGLML